MDIDLDELQKQQLNEIAEARVDQHEAKRKHDRIVKDLEKTENEVLRSKRSKTLQGLIFQKMIERKKAEARQKMRETPLHERPAGLTRAGRSYSDRSDRSDSSNDSNVIIF